MTELKSECCGADVIKIYHGITHNGITHAVGTWFYGCSKCHKPCEVRKEEGEDEKR